MATRTRIIPVVYGLAFIAALGVAAAPALAQPQESDGSVPDWEGETGPDAVEDEPPPPEGNSTESDEAAGDSPWYRGDGSEAAEPEGGDEDDADLDDG